MKIRLKTKYDEDLKIFDALFLYIMPLLSGNYILYLLNLAGIYTIVSLGLNLLTGYTGQISLGHAAFFATGAYCSGYLTNTLGMSFWLALPLSGMVAGMMGVVIGFPSLRLKGLYLAIATMAFAFIVEEMILQLDSITNGANGMNLSHPAIGCLQFSTYGRFYYLTVSLVVLCVFVTKNIVRSGWDGL